MIDSMSSRVLIAFVLLAVGASAAGESRLVLVESEAADVSARGRVPRQIAEFFPVVFVGPGYCLGYADEYQVERFRERGGRVTVLDPEPEGESYVYVMDRVGAQSQAESGFDRRRLDEFGTALWEDEEGVVLRTSEEGISGLNTLPVELVGIGPEPWVFAEHTPVPEPASVPSSLIWELVGRLNPDSTEAKMRRLIAFRTRYSTTDSCRRAMGWMQNRFEEYGCDTTYLESFRASYAPNVVGVKRGRVNPRQVYVVCGHVDNTSEIPQTLAPGSDDNASGAVAALEALRAFAGTEFERTVWFVGFSGEEQGLVGSDSLVRRCRERGDSIALGINFDMISYGLVDSITVVYTSMLPQTEQFAEFFVAQADTFTGLKSRKMLLNDAASDHYSFWKYGYPAIRGRYRDRTPMYHTTGDTIGPLRYVNCGTNNIPMQTEVIKALVATVAKLAGAYVPSGVGEKGWALHTVPSMPGAGIVHGSLFLPGVVGGAQLLDATGRKVMSIRPGENDVSLLAPGVYFLQDGQARVARRVVVAK